MTDAYFLPPDTSSLIDTGMAACKNLGLILDKYVPQDVIEDGKKKGDWLKYLVHDSSNAFDANLLSAFQLRWQSMLNAFPIMFSFTASLAWRMIIGLGGESVLETDLTLHHLYGLPFIPASALKGLTRAYAANEDERYFILSSGSDQKLIPSPEPKEDHEVLQRIFGSQNQAGSVLFFDAQPATDSVSFIVDIMNPHYPDYYNSLKSNPKPPTNDQSPNPITFLTIAETSFTFALAPRNPQDEQHQKDAEQAQAWLKLALQKYGIGSKTSAGYGYFNNLSDVIQIPIPEADPIETTSPAQKTYERPKMPAFRAGQEIKASVVPPTEDLRKIAPEAQAFLRYESFALKDVLLIVTIENAQFWKPGDTRICLFLQEEVRDGCTILICEPRVKKGRS